MSRSLNISELKCAVNCVLDRISEKLNISEIQIEDDRDFYWEIDGGGLYNMAIEIPSVSVGRLSDDWDFAQRILNDPEEAVSLTLAHIAPLLRYVGEKIGQ
jgi:hypothetical protein